MAEWIGQFIGQFSGWLLAPFIILIAIVYLLVAVLIGNPSYIEWPFNKKRRYLGEKKELKHGKK